MNMADGQITTEKTGKEAEGCKGTTIYPLPVPSGKLT